MAALVHDRVAGRGEGTPRAGVGPQRAARPAHVARDPWIGRAVPHGRNERRGGPAVVAAVVVLTLAAVGGSLADAAAGLGGGRSRAGERGEVAAGEADVSRRPGDGSGRVAQPGETYWSIAEELGADGDIRERVDALVEANGGRVLRAGDRLALPQAD